MCHILTLLTLSQALFHFFFVFARSYGLRLLALSIFSTPLISQHPLSSVHRPPSSSSDRPNVANLFDEKLPPWRARPTVCYSIGGYSKTLVVEPMAEPMVAARPWGY